ASLYLHATSQVSPVFDANAGSDDIARHRTLAAHGRAVVTNHIAVDLAHDDDFAGMDVSRHRAISANRDAVLRDVDGAFDPAIDIQRFAPTHFAFDYQRAANAGLLEGRVRPLYRRVVTSSRRRWR